MKLHWSKHGSGLKGNLGKITCAVVTPPYKWYGGGSLRRETFRKVFMRINIGNVTCPVYYNKEGAEAAREWADREFMEWSELLGDRKISWRPDRRFVEETWEEDDFTSGHTGGNRFAVTADRGFGPRDERYVARFQLPDSSGMKARSFFEREDTAANWAEYRLMGWFREAGI